MPNKTIFLIKTVLITVVVVQVANLALAFYWFQGLTAVKAPHTFSDEEEVRVFVFDVPPDVQVPRPLQPLSAFQPETVENSEGAEAEDSAPPLRLVREDLDFASALSRDLCIRQIAHSGMAVPEKFPLVEREWHIVEACAADLLDLVLNPQLSLNFDPLTGHLIFQVEGQRAEYEKARGQILSRLIKALEVLEDDLKPESANQPEEIKPKGD